MSIKEDLALRVKEDFSGWLLLTSKPEFTLSPPSESPKVIQPFDFYLAYELEKNMMTFIIVTTDPGDEMFYVPKLIQQKIIDIKQGKSGGGGSFLLAGENFNSKEMMFNKQVYIYTDKFENKKDEVVSFYKKLGLRVLLKEFGNNITLEKRSALIIGVGEYQNIDPLVNPINDANSMNDKLTKLGFVTTKLIDPDLRTLKVSVESFAANIIDSDVCLVYFAGHGIQSKGINYLVPTDANCHKEIELEFDCMAANLILAKLERAEQCKTKIIILDACRNNPFTSIYRSLSHKGLAAMNAPEGTFIAYATSPGKTASDGTESNGLYTSELLNHIETPYIVIEELFKRVRKGVKKQSNGNQIPWETTSLTGEFSFKK